MNEAKAIDIEALEGTIKALRYRIETFETLCLRAADALEEHSWKEPQAGTDDLIDELRKAAK